MGRTSRPTGPTAASTGRDVLPPPGTAGHRVDEHLTAPATLETAAEGVEHGATRRARGLHRSVQAVVLDHAGHRTPRAR